LLDVTTPTAPMRITTADAANTMTSGAVALEAKRKA
jgi:hypothetical protein